MIYDLAKFLGRFHILIVHFPIAIIALSLLSEVQLARTNDIFYARSTQLLLRLGVVAIVGAVLLGWLLGFDAVFQEDTEIYFLLHKTIGSVSLGLLLLTTWMDAQTKPDGNRTKLRILLGLTAAAIIVTAHCGGSLVFGPTYLMF